MRETIKLVMDAEKQASEIVSEARKQASDLLNMHNSEYSEKINEYRSKELTRYNDVVQRAEQELLSEIDDIRNTEVKTTADLERISEKVLCRVMQTVFD